MNQEIHVEMVCHASFRMWLAGGTFTTDPWYKGAIACNSTFHFPPLRHSIEEVAKYTRALYISHIHPDHFSPATLAYFDRGVPVFIGDYRLKHFREGIRALGFTVHEIPFQEKVRVEELDATIAILESDYEETAAYDSAIVIEAGGFTVFNNNDCFLRDAKIEWVRRNFSVDYGFIGFSPASFYYPASFEFEPEVRDRLLHEAAERRYADFARVARGVQPRIAIPFASGARLLHRDLLWKNTCFNSALEAVNRLQGSGLRGEVLGPGDCILADGQVRRVAPVLDRDQEARAIGRYAQDRESELENLWREEAPARSDVVAQFRDYVLELWDQYRDALPEVADSVIAYRLTGPGGGSFYFDFSRPATEIFRTGEPDTYDMRYTYPANLLQMRLDGSIDWDELHYSNRISIDQKRFAREFYAMLRSETNPVDKVRAAGGKVSEQPIPCDESSGRGAGGAAAFDRWIVDIELTNRCNALCHFCPRDKTPQQGFISEATLHSAVARVAELSPRCPVVFAGQGEPLLHPGVAAFVGHVRAQGIHCGITTNGSLLDAELAGELLAAGLDRIYFSVSDLFADYTRVYNLEFSKTLQNILAFLEISNGRCEVEVNIVVRPDNADKVAGIRAFWERLGITRFNSWAVNNRGGSCASNHRFLATDRLEAQAREAIRACGATDVCAVPYKMVFVGWNGNYYICCNDYAKERPLGTVDELGIVELDGVKYAAYREGLEPCRQCNLEPVNAVREAMLQVEAGSAPHRAVATVLGRFKAAKQLLPEWVRADAGLAGRESGSGDGN